MNSSAKVALPRTFLGHGALAQMLWIVGFAAATALGARVEIPHAPIPYTLQTLVVLLAGAFLGPLNGAYSQMLYIASGLGGLPVFAGGAAGILILTGPSGGYLMAFPAAAAVVGLMLERRQGLGWAFASMASGLLIVFSFGTLHLYAFTTHNLGAAISSGFVIFTWWDLLKLSAAAMIYHEVAKRWKRIPEDVSQGA